MPMIWKLNVTDLSCGDGPEAGASTTGEIARHFYGVWGAAQVWVDPISAWRNQNTNISAKLKIKMLKFDNSI